MFATGFAIFLGLVFIFIKLGRRTMLRMLGHDVWLDIGVTMLTLAIHWGTFALSDEPLDRPPAISRRRVRRGKRQATPSSRCRSAGRADSRLADATGRAEIELRQRAHRHALVARPLRDHLRADRGVGRVAMVGVGAMVPQAPHRDP